MSVEIQQSELRSDNAAIMRRVADGESFVVTVNGRPVADVVPHRGDPDRRQFVPVAELAEAFAENPVPAPEEWQADIDTADDIFGSNKPTDPFEQEKC